MPSGPHESLNVNFRGVTVGSYLTGEAGDESVVLNELVGLGPDARASLVSRLRTLANEVEYWTVAAFEDGPYERHMATGDIYDVFSEEEVERNTVYGDGATLHTRPHDWPHES